MDVVGQEVSYHRVTMAIAKAWGPQSFRAINL